jgi:HAD superfamily hydrolase (TIGR01509 family)
MKYKITDVDGFIFDMDGVIFDSEKIGLESWATVGRRYGLTNVEETAKKCIGRNTAGSMKIFEEAYGHLVSIPELYKEGKEVFRSIVAERGLPLKSGATELLTWLHNNNVKVGLASSTAYDIVVRQLTEAGLINFFQIVVGGDMVEHSKPQPEIYLLACQKLEVRPEKTFAVEDSYNGILSAYRAGMLPVLVPDLTPPNEEMLKMAHCKANSLDEILECLLADGL